MRRVIIFALTVMLLIAACTNQNGGGGGLLGLDSGPTAVVDQDQGIQTAITFLDSWVRQDYNTMYGLLSPNARDAYPQSEFTNEFYEKIWQDLNLQSLNWERGEVLSQGTTVLFQYSVTFQSTILGTFTDPERLMRIIPTDEGMRIAWSSMDIFEGWSSGARLRPERFMPSRGNIYDSQGRTLADQNGVSLSIYLVKQQMPDPNGCVELLRVLFGREVDDINREFAKYNPDTRFYFGDIDPETYQTQQALLQSKCNPYQVDERSTRRYFATAAPHVVGFVGSIPIEQIDDYTSQGYPVNALVGIQGIEGAWEDELRGTIGNRLSLVSVTDETMRVIAEQPASPGQSVYLTIDRELQRGIQEAFAEAYSISAPTWSTTSPGAAAVILDVNTGAVLAMVSYPSFDPGVFNPDFNPYFDPGSTIQGYYNDARRPLLNRATQGRYPLGSVFKLVSSTAAADSGIMPLDTLNTCSGTWYGGQYGDSRESRTDWKPDGHGVLDGRGAIINSCNPYYWQIGVAMNNADQDLLTDYARMMGLGVPTGIRGVEEDSGLIPDAEYLATQGITWGVATALNQVIGQGDTAVNPLQVARMVAVIANGGKLVTPYLVQEVKLIGETPIYVHEPEIKQLDLDPEVLAEVRQAMCDVTTTPAGTANFIFQDWYEFQNRAVTVCGKTGTAQSSENQPPHAWFASFAPAENPEIAVVVVVENSCEGSEVAAPIVRRLIELYYNLPFGVWPSLWQGACTQIGE